ncbi:MAG: hypothetical protein ACRDPO_18490 [Streptosporangiaceae bacterium]
MSDEVRRIEPEDDEIAEEWVRLTDEPEIRGVEAYTTGEDVTGTPSGEALTRAAASVIDDLADRLRAG